MKAEEWIHNETVASAKRYVWVEKAFAEAGLTFTEEEQASIDSQLDTIWANNEALLAANGIGRENYRRFYECEAKYEKLLAEYQDGESDKITDAEAGSEFTCPTFWNSRATVVAMTHRYTRGRNT